jgi:putative chitinase
MSILGFLKKLFESDTVEEAFRKWSEEKKGERKNEGKLPEEPKLPEIPKLPDLPKLPEEPKLPDLPKLPEEKPEVVIPPVVVPPVVVPPVVEKVFTTQNLKKMFPTTPDATIALYVDALNELCFKYDINTLNRRAMFIAQVGHESGGFKYVKESLNMSAARICAVWPNRFATEEASAPYANNPEALANNVYSNRMGNGPEESGEGFKFRGRGLIQITGKDNYSAFAKSIGMSLDEVISYLETPAGSVESAGWYWKARALNVCADNDDVKTCTKKINGGYVGLEDRTQLYLKAKLIFV